MKYSIDTYSLYRSEKRFSYVIRARVKMKKKVDIDVLKESANKAIKRYPYFAVRVVVKDGAYQFVPNDKEIVVIPVKKKTPHLGSEEVNRHLLFIECAGRNIYFNISHTMCGGRGLQPLVMTTLWQYVADKYGVEPEAPAIRKPGEPLLDGETAEPSFDLLPKEAPIYQYKSKNPKILLLDYLNGMFNPFARDNYRVVKFTQKDLITYAKDHDLSVAAFFLVTMAKTMDKILPPKVEVIGGEIAHSMAANIGLKNAHCDILSHVHIDYTREQLKMDMEKLGTMTRGQITLQTDPSVSCVELRKKMELCEGIDSISGIRDKRAYMKENNLYEGKNAKHGTYYVNYTGQMDWGELADYIDSYVLIVEGHVMLEVTSMGNFIFACFMQMIETDKYFNAFTEVMKEIGIDYTVEGPFPKRLSRHELPEA